MKIPVIAGLIRRRILLNYRADPDVVRKLLPARLRPQLQHGHALVGVCLIRLEQIRPRRLPRAVGISSENAAHRIAVSWEDDSGRECQGVYILRRDTSGWLNYLAGGRVFPGEHHLADFRVNDRESKVALAVRSRDGAVSIDVAGRECERWPTDSVFRSLDEASAFHERGALGYSVTRNPHRLDGLLLKSLEWRVRAFEVELSQSSYFDDVRRFPPGSITLDHALLMRDIEHQWQAACDLCV